MGNFLLALDQTTSPLVVYTLVPNSLSGLLLFAQSDYIIA